MKSLLSTRRLPLRQSSVAAALLLAILAGGVGIPVIDREPAPTKDLSVPFPCQHRRCGCKDAASCWKKCCCFTNEQKLAWAKKHGVAVPKNVRTEVQVASVLTAKTCGAGKQVASCCAKKIKQQESPAADRMAKDRSTNDRRLSLRERVLLSRSESRRSDSNCSSVPNGGSAKLRFVVTEQMRQCGGMGAVHLIFSQALLPEIMLLQCDSPEITDRLVLTSETLASRSDSPSLRPPRICG